MRKSMFVIIAIGAALASAGMARADRIAGWDFSQYATAGRLTIDGTTVANTLDANYSDLNPKGGAGSDLGIAATLYMDGSFGSSNVGTTIGSTTVQPQARNAVLGYTANAYRGGITGNGEGFDLFGLVTRPGNAQANAEFLALQANTPVTLVFQADVSSLYAGGAQNWSVSFGGETLTSNANVIPSLDVGCDGSVEVTGSAIVVSATSGATAQTQAFAGLNTATNVCVRLAAFGGAIVDNVEIEATPVPEPGSVMMLAAGALALFGLGRVGKA